MYLNIILLKYMDVQIGAKSCEYFGLKKLPLIDGRKYISQCTSFKLAAKINYYKVFILLKLTKIILNIIIYIRFSLLETFIRKKISEKIVNYRHNILLLPIITYFIH